MTLNFRFTEELGEGIYIQQSLETVFMDTEGKQVCPGSMHSFDSYLYTSCYRLRVNVTFCLVS